jgi:uncharacterized protein YprB with RNaseH-like and TPR domain/predicted nuclease with RNAse H fold/dephospho-CoA kinase
MLTYTFQHIRGIGSKKERELWRSGVKSWEDLASRTKTQLSMFGVSDEKNGRGILDESRQALEAEDADFFAHSLPRQEHHRIALGFPTKTLFLDIETTGLSTYYDTITLVGWSIGSQYQVYVRGGDEEPLRSALANAKAIVTFNGALFDLPFLRHEFSDLRIPSVHVDLRFFAKRFGLSGGQKEIEKELGLSRPVYLQGMAGEAAPLLWHKYKQGELDALKLLISYNHADIEGMKYIFDAVMERLVEKQEFPAWGRAFHHFSANGSELPKWEAGATETFNGNFRLKPYEGKTGPAITLSDLDLGIKPLKIIGIDLTGSESRPSGWCLLDGAFAETQRIGSDEDLIKATVETSPSLVSIDSPLSLPMGRIVVTDDDPGRKTYGITRYCERVLKRRGINVYPSLIQSMQALTSRGIRLARHFRSLGIPVIESYPGAAQDIINIPRKQADLGLLKKGLHDFGLKGDFITESVSHDELDAITSAIVGLFFMSGRFEALGNEDEEYLIIPDTDPEKNPWRKRKVIGLSGPISSGKTTAGKHLESLGFTYGRYSLVLKELLQDRGEPITRESLQGIGEAIYKEPGQRWLCRELIKRMPEAGDLVIDGLRHPEDHSFLVETFGPDFLHIHIDAPESIRLKRYDTDEGTKDEFMTAIAHPVEANIPKLAVLAHELIRNTGTLEVFLSEILRIVSTVDELEREDYITCL